jgi:hypothetical protein
MNIENFNPYCINNYISNENLEKICLDYKILNFYILFDLKRLYLYIYDSLTNSQDEMCAIINERSKYLRYLSSTYLEVFRPIWECIDLIELRTGIKLDVDYVGKTEGNSDLNDEFYWVFDNAYKLTKVGKKFKKYINHKYRIKYH